MLRLLLLLLLRWLRERPCLQNDCTVWKVLVSPQLLGCAAGGAPLGEALPRDTAPPGEDLQHSSSAAAAASGAAFAVVSGPLLGLRWFNGDRVCGKGETDETSSLQEVVEQACCCLRGGHCSKWATFGSTSTSLGVSAR